MRHRCFDFILRFYRLLEPNGIFSRKSFLAAGWNDAQKHETLCCVLARAMHLNQLANPKIEIRLTALVSDLRFKACILLDKAVLSEASHRAVLLVNGIQIRAKSLSEATRLT